MRNSKSLPALSSAAPVTTRTSRRDTGTACAAVAQSAHANNIGQIDRGSCNFTAPSRLIDEFAAIIADPNECSPRALTSDLTIVGDVSNERAFRLHDHSKMAAKSS